jgi:hypothetical protein
MNSDNTKSSLQFAQRPIARRFVIQFALLGVLATLALGCAKPFEVTREKVPKAKTPPPGDRLLAAMVPLGQQAWFFKLSGKKELVEAQADTFHELLKSLTVKDGEPEWKTPDSWKEQPGTGMRKATFVIATGGTLDKVNEYSGNSAAASLECTVIPLPSINVLANVNRWRKQIGLPNLRADELKPEKGGSGELNEFEMEDGITVTWVNLEGNMIGGSSPPFAGMAGMGPMQGGMPPDHPAAPQPPADDNATQGPVGPAGPPRVLKFVDGSINAMSFKVPTHWKSGPPRQFREKTWNIKERGQECEASISTLGPSAAEGEGLAANINRWRKQAGLPPISSEGINSSLDTIEIDGQPGHLSLIRGPRKTTIGVIVAQGGKTWFLKLTGQVQITASEQEGFAKFLESIKFK